MSNTSMEGNPIPSELAVLRAKKAEVAQKLDAASDRRAKRQEEKDLILLYIKNALAAESLPIALLVENYTKQAGEMMKEIEKSATRMEEEAMEHERQTDDEDAGALSRNAAQRLRTIARYLRKIVENKEDGQAIEDDWNEIKDRMTLEYGQQ